MESNNRAIIQSEIMNHSVKGYWNERKEKLKQRFADLTDDDLTFLEGKETEMIEMLGYKLGKTKQELLHIIIAL